MEKIVATSGLAFKITAERETLHVWWSKKRILHYKLKIQLLTTALRYEHYYINQYEQTGIDK